MTSNKLFNSSLLIYALMIASAMQFVNIFFIIFVLFELICQTDNVHGQKTYLLRRDVHIIKL